MIILMIANPPHRRTTTTPRRIWQAAPPLHRPRPRGRRPSPPGTGGTHSAARRLGATAVRSPSASRRGFHPRRPCRTVARRPSPAPPLLPSRPGNRPRREQKYNRERERDKYSRSLTSIILGWHSHCHITGVDSARVSDCARENPPASERNSPRSRTQYGAVGWHTACFVVAVQLPVSHDGCSDQLGHIHLATLLRRRG